MPDCCLDVMVERLFTEQHVRSSSLDGRDMGKSDDRGRMFPCYPSHAYINVRLNDGLSFLHILLP